MKQLSVLLDLGTFTIWALKLRYLAKQAYCIDIIYKSWKKIMFIDIFT